MRGYAELARLVRETARKRALAVLCSAQATQADDVPVSVLVNASCYVGAGGIPRYVECLIDHLAQYEDVVVHVIVPLHERHRFFERFCHVPARRLYVHEVKVPSAFSPLALLRTARVVNDLVRRTDADTVVFPHFNVLTPLVSVPGDVAVFYVVHDLRPFTEWWDRGRVKGLIARLLLSAFVRAAARRARTGNAYVVCVSQFTRQSVLRRWHSVPETAADAFYPMPPQVLPQYLERAAGRRKQQKSKPGAPLTLTWLGAFKQHKGADAFLAAARALVERLNLRVFALGASDRGVKTRNFPANVMVIPDADDETVAEVMSETDLMTFPSRFEGFGIPPWEAALFGAPALVTASVPSAYEICPKCFIVVDDCNEKLLQRSAAKTLTLPAVGKRVKVNCNCVLRKWQGVRRRGIPLEAESSKKGS